MYDKIVEHALNNVWCNLEHDRQHIFKLHRISQKSGVINRISVMMHTVNLPTPRERYFVYQIGHVHPNLMNLLTKQPEWLVGEWIQVSEAMNTLRNLMVDIYNDSGIQIPRFCSYYMLTSDGTLLFCFKRDARIPVDYINESFYVRFYSNAYFRTPEFDTQTNLIYTSGIRFTSVESFVEEQSKMARFQNLPGLVSIYRNGVLMENVTLAQFKPNDILEWVYDSSVLTTVEIRVDKLPRFESLLDKTAKQLFHYKPDLGNTIYFMDDVDFYVCLRGTGIGMRGVYYHKNSPSSCRMVTHCDYALSAQNIVNHTLALQTALAHTTIPQNKTYIRAIIRRSGYNRPLVYEKNRIFELFKLPEDKIEQAMVGVNSTVPVWKAQNLENSQYCKVMRVYANEVNRNLVERAYGYNGLTKILADTPILVNREDTMHVKVPMGLRTLSTAFEYDVNGLLIGRYRHDDSEVYVCRNFSTQYVEMLPGIGTHAVDIKFGVDKVPLTPKSGYRVYLLNKETENVTDISNTERYKVDGDEVVCDQTLTNNLVVVKTDNNFLCYDINTLVVEGVLYFTLSQMENRGDGLKHHAMTIPWRYWDIFLNGRLLTEGLDYAIDFPKVVIWNKKYLKVPEDITPQNIVVRACGFCKSDLTWVKPNMVGFIDHDVLLDNNRFDITDDKVQLITVDGLVRHKSELKFGDTHSGVSVTGARNGLPYRVNNTYIPVSSHTLNTTDVLLNEAETIDKQVSNYLSTLLPEPERNAVSAIPERYVVYSPFVSRLLEAVSEGDHDADLTRSTLTDSRILQICKMYEPWLKVDPTQPETPVDDRYVQIHPTVKVTTTALTLLQYRFMRRVVELYCHGLVDLSEFVTFS